MYVIFPLEDLLDPHSGLNRRLVENVVHREPPSNGNSEVAVSSPPSYPNHTAPPNLQLPSLSQAGVTLPPPQPLSPPLASSSVPSIFVTADVSRSGSFRSLSQCAVPTGTPQQKTLGASAVSGKSTQPIPEQPEKPPITSKPPVEPIKKTLQPPQQQAIKKQVFVIQQPHQLAIAREQSAAGELETQHEQLNVGPTIQQTHLKKSHSFTSKAASFLGSRKSPRTPAAAVSLVTAGNFLGVHQVDGSACDKLADSDAATTITANAPRETSLSNRNSLPRNLETRLSLSSSTDVVDRSASVRSKESIRPSVPQSSVSFVQEDSTVARRRTEFVSPRGLPKDIVIQQTSAFSGANDSGVSARESNNSVCGGGGTGDNVAVVGASKESNLLVKSPLGSGNRTGGLVRESSFSGSDLAQRAVGFRSRRSGSSVESGGEGTVARTGSVRSTSSSAKSRLSESRPPRSPLVQLPPEACADPHLQTKTKPKTSSLESPQFKLQTQGQLLESPHTKPRAWVQPLDSPHTKPRAQVQPLDSPHSKPRAEAVSLDPDNEWAERGRGGLQRSVMATGGGEAGLRHLTHPALNEALKAHNNVTFKLLKTVSEFSAQLSRLHEHHGEQLQHLVHTFRKKNSELRNERPTPGGPVAMAWESLLQEVEVDSQLHVDVAATLTRDVARPLVENTFYRKIEARKVFAHRESFDVIIGKAEEQLKKHKRDYTEAYRTHCATMTNGSLAAHLDAHNSYVTQLRATNGMLTEYHTNALPALLKELEDVLMDVGNIASSCITQAAEIVATKTGEQHQRYQALTRNCRNVDGRTDVSALVKSLDIPNPPRPLHRFCPPQLPQTSDGEDGPHTPQDPAQPTYHNEVVEDRLAEVCTRTRLESLSREAAELTRQIQQNQESQEGLVRAQQRSLDAGIHNKANEIQEDISLKRFDIRVAQLHLGAVKAQKELFSPRDGTGVEGRDRKMSSSSTGSMKSKWMKAFKSLKTPSSSSNPPKESADRRTGGRGGELSPPIFENSHIFQEYTYKKISACDVCHQILKGHSRQGLKCKLCKVNVHPDCQAEAPRCQPKSRLLRRQRSTSEIETKHIEVEEDDCGEPNLTFNSLIASQPGRRTLEPPSPTGQGPHDQAGRRHM